MRWTYRIEDANCYRGPLDLRVWRSQMGVYIVMDPRGNDVAVYASVGAARHICQLRNFQLT